MGPRKPLFYGETEARRLIFLFKKNHFTFLLKWVALEFYVENSSQQNTVGYLNNWIFLFIFIVSEMPRQNSRSGTLSIFLFIGIWIFSFFSISSYRLGWKTGFENFSRCHSKRGLKGDNQKRRHLPASSLTGVALAVWAECQGVVMTLKSVRWGSFRWGSRALCWCLAALLVG